MTTYTDQQQRMLDQQSGAEMDKRAAKRAMTTQHTPGPWRLGQVWGTQDILAGLETAPTTIAKVRIGGKGEANARLIAAAPELLAALQALEWKAGNAVAALEATGKTANGMKAACEAARAAIAKATGGAS